MKKILILFLLLSFNNQIISEINTEGYKFINCALKPFIKKTDKTQLNKFPIFKNSTMNSQNWCGYAQATNLSAPTTNSVTNVSGTWNVPTLSATPDQSYCYIWVGIDGLKNSSVEQIGTSHSWVNGAPSHFAWYEMYPLAPAVIYGFPVNSGDSISASVAYQGNGVFLLSIANNTKKVHTSIPTQYTTSTTALRTSAEWIVEAPGNPILPLAHFSPITMSECICVINGLTKQINSTFFQNIVITMTHSGVIKAQPSALSTSGQRFNVTWQHE